MTTKNSGRLPSVACSKPVAAGPNRCPTCSVANDTIHAAPGQRDARDHEREHVPEAARVAGDRGQDRDRRDGDKPDPLDT